MSRAARGPALPAPGGGRPERWRTDAGEAAVATLVIPPDPRRERRFEISCTMTVRVVADAAAPWHRLTVLADGSRQWQRRIDSSRQVDTDGLDYRFERSLPPGQSLRLVAEVACHGALRRSLVIEAEEVND